MLHMLDTDIASYAIKGRSPRVEAKLQTLNASDICISVITRAEILYGLNRLPPQHILHAAVRKFFAIVRVFPWDSDAASFYADIRHQLAESGKIIGEMDMMIAAHSLSIAAVLVTNNTRDYQRIAAPLMLQNWT